MSFCLLRRSGRCEPHLHSATKKDWRGESSLRDFDTPISPFLSPFLSPFRVRKTNPSSLRIISSFPNRKPRDFHIFATQPTFSQVACGRDPRIEPDVWSQTEKPSNVSIAIENGLYIYIHIYIYMYTYIHIYTYIYIFFYLFQNELYTMLFFHSYVSLPEGISRGFLHLLWTSTTWPKVSVLLVLWEQEVAGHCEGDISAGVSWR